MPPRSHRSSHNFRRRPTSNLNTNQRNLQTVAIRSIYPKPTMTIFKPASSNAPPSPKQMPKRGSKTSTFKNHATEDTEETIEVIPSDASLQSPNCRRRYMRRGSRVPSMFRHTPIPSLESLFETEHDSRAPKDAEQPQQRLQRRLSIVSLLAKQLEMNAIVESPNIQSREASSTTLRPLKLQRETSVPTNE